MDLAPFSSAIRFAFFILDALPLPVFTLALTNLIRLILKILDQDSRKQFASLIEDLQLPTQHWRAIEIFEGPQALDETGLISRFSEPLARQHLDLIYVSTYNTDLIFVEEGNVERAVTALQQVANGYPRSASPGPQQLGPDVTPKFASQDDVEALQEDCTDTHILEKLSSDMHLVNFAASSVPALTHTLLQLFLFPREEARFFSYTAYGGQVTMILDSIDFASLQPQLSSITHHEDLWNVIHIQASAEGIDSSVLNYAARILAQNHISIYYLSTLNDDYILVPQESSSAALECLQGRPSSPTS